LFTLQLQHVLGNWQNMENSENSPTPSVFFLAKHLVSKVLNNAPMCNMTANQPGLI